MYICIYGASSSTIDPSYIEAAETLGEKIAAAGDGIIFGGGAKGLMGAAARGATRGGGEIIGVAPTFFDVDGILYPHCTSFVYTETMRERKQIMEDRADGFIMLPGGIGTYEEFFEILTLRQLGRHQKPIAVYNINGYYDALVAFLTHTMRENFITPACLGLFRTFENADKMLAFLRNYTPEKQDIWKIKGV